MRQNFQDVHRDNRRIKTVVKLMGIPYIQAKE
jgi:hypothetical protein